METALDGKQPEHSCLQWVGCTRLVVSLFFCVKRKTNVLYGGVDFLYFEPICGVLACIIPQILSVDHMNVATNQRPR